MGQKGTKMTTFRTHFTFRVDTWTPDGDPPFHLGRGSHWRTPARWFGTFAFTRALRPRGRLINNPKGGKR
jgi:hypothetical protein